MTQNSRNDANPWRNGHCKYHINGQL